MSKKKKLGVNIDHVATIRNARNENYPSPLKAALLAQQSGADSVTIHLREDRRHIRDHDLKSIIKKLKIPLNLEIAPTKEMTRIALKNVPDHVCIVPEKRKEITTEGGLDITKNRRKIKNIIKLLRNKNIRVSLFIEPKISDVILSKSLGADCVELHTGKFCNIFNQGKEIKKNLKKITDSANYANKIGLKVHAGHGLTYKSTRKITKIKNISEFNIGHFIVAESLFLGLRKTIKKFKSVINK